MELVKKIWTSVGQIGIESAVGVRNRDDERVILTNQLAFVIWLYVIPYSFLYAGYGAWMGAIACGAGAVLAIPAVFLFNRNQKYTSAKLLVIFYSTAVITVSGYSFGQDIGVASYYLPASLLGLLLFRSNERISTVLATSIPISFWVLSYLYMPEILPNSLVAKSGPIELFKVLNYIGAYVINLIFCFTFIRSILEYQKREVKLSKFSALGEMSAGIAHEINNPLMAINAAVSRIKADPGSPRVLDRIEIVKKMSDRIHRITKGLQRFSRSDDEEVAELATVASILDDTLLICHERIELGGVRLEINIPPTLKLQCKSLQLSQVLLNLIMNSYYEVRNNQSSWIKVDAGVIAETDFDPECIVILVTDSGDGISSDIQERLMEPFFTTKEVGQGTGLGLSISAGIVESHGGTLEYNPRSKNTQFIIKLPAIKSYKSAA